MSTPTKKQPKKPVHKPGASSGKPKQIHYPNEWVTDVHRHHGMTVGLYYMRGLTPNGIFHHNEPLWLQCPPMAPFTITRGHNSTEYSTAFNGTFSVNADAKLTLVTFKTLFVNFDEPWVRSPHMDIDQARDTLEELSMSGAPFRLLCTHKHNYNPEFDNHVTLTDYTHSEDEPDTYYSDLTFKQYRDPLAGARRHGGKTWPKHHKLVAKDTLYSLAKHYYGKPSLARNIATANKIHSTHFDRPIVKLGGKWKVGVNITIPAPPKGSHWHPPHKASDAHKTTHH